MISWLGALSYTGKKSQKPRKPAQPPAVQAIPLAPPILQPVPANISLELDIKLAKLENKLTLLGQKLKECVEVVQPSNNRTVKTAYLAIALFLRELQSRDIAVPPEAVEAVEAELASVIHKQQLQIEHFYE